MKRRLRFVGPLALLAFASTIECDLDFDFGTRWLVGAVGLVATLLANRLAWRELWAKRQTTVIDLCFAVAALGAFLPEFVPFQETWGALACYSWLLFPIRFFSYPYFDDDGERERHSMISQKANKRVDNCFWLAFWTQLASLLYVFFLYATAFLF